MTAVRLIPCLDIRDGRVVKGVNFEGLRDAGDPVALGAYYDREGADELVFLDISASIEGRAPVIDLAQHVAKEIFIPFTVGGGLRSVADIRDALLAGADKVSLNSAAIQTPELIRQAADQFGSQCIVVAIDAKRRDDGGWAVFSHGGKRLTALDAVTWAQDVAQLGAGEILLTSMDGDGVQKGYDLELTRSVSESVGIPVIASGGAGHPDHLVEAVREGKADAVLLASILHDRDFSVASLKAAMSAAGLCVRTAPDETQTASYQ